MSPSDDELIDLIDNEVMPDERTDTYWRKKSVGGRTMNQVSAGYAERAQLNLHLDRDLQLRIRRHCKQQDIPMAKWVGAVLNRALPDD